ncbi:ABC-type branched-chain amino acid transport system periplasmic component [Rhodovulum sp. P5]|uniref:penicillin-binding protein activator n=1 Tax=Rhodovulum sp. P5 TaxID=1564506 RepID=UPI0009C30928|nr:penicillin-binding protein activator [Rhodovulum sp. P5]ARE39774.1 ABC-type branched-chain amino acid transport system periplasmic component [Rhodovulum sp. P5]
MLAVFGAPRKRIALALAALAFLTACQAVTMGGGPRINTDKPVPVALLVPSGSGSGTDEEVARGLENAARMAIADLQGAKIDLRVYSTGANPERAAAVARDAVSDGAKIILGPLYAQSANAVGVAVAGRGVNVLSFSNNTQIAGRNVFVLGPTFENTADRLAGYAASQGKSRFMVIHDPDISGQVGRQAIEGAVAARGGQVVTTGTYELSQNAVVQAIPGLAAKARENGVDSIFFTASPTGALGYLVQLLPDNRVDPTQVQFIGLTRWDIPPSTLSLPELQGGWFALPDPGRSARFQSRYAATYGNGPHSTAGLAYDGIAAIGALISNGQADALTVTALTQRAGFEGVNGAFRLNPDGTNDRALAVAEIRNSQVNVIDPAPRSFGGAGF